MINRNARQDLIHLINILPNEEIHIATRFLQFLMSGKTLPRKISAAELAGKYAHLNLSTEKFNEEKQKEIDLEEEKYRRHFGK